MCWIIELPRSSAAEVELAVVATTAGITIQNYELQQLAG